MDKNELKEKFMKLYLDGKNYSEIGKLTGWSRTFVTKLIEKDPRIIEVKNKKTVKIYKRKDNHQFQLYIPNEFIRKLGITADTDSVEYMDIYLDEENKNIILKKHSEK